MEWKRYGAEAVLIYFGVERSASASVIRAVLGDLARNPRDDIVDCTPAFDKLLIEFSPGTDVPQCASELVDRFASLEPVPAIEAPLLEIPVIYDGEDLSDLAEIKGLSPGDVVDLHSAVIYTVSMLGFSPGFPYLSGLDRRLYTARRPSPRAVVAAGSVAIGGPHTGIYTIDSPGGWHLIGRTEVKIFDPARGVGDEVRMFLLSPGDRVRFVPVEEFDE